MAKNIKELFLFENYKIIVFEGYSFYYTIKSNYVCHSISNKSADAIENDFANFKKLDNYKVLGKLSNLNDKKCDIIFKEAKVNKYPNFNKNGEYLQSSLESIKSYIIQEGYTNLENIWIIIPTPTKKLIGKKIKINFNIVSENYKDIKGYAGAYYKDIELDVYISDLNKSDIKKITYSVEIPYWIYDFLSTHPDLEKRLTSKIYTTEMFSDIHKYFNNICADMTNLLDFDKEQQKLEKVILIDFKSGYNECRDNYMFGYTGKQTVIKFKFFIGYKYNKKDVFNNSSRYIHVDKVYEQGKGYVSCKNRLVPVHDTNNCIIIEWSQEREIFLMNVEYNFENLSNNLNKYLQDITKEKLDVLLQNNIKFIN